MSGKLLSSAILLGVFVLCGLSSPLRTAAGPTVHFSPVRIAGGSLARPQESDIEIINTGSTNTAGYRIWVSRSGSARWMITRRRPGAKTVDQVNDTLPAELAKRSFEDVEAAMPLASLPEQHCAKSASFGSSTLIRFRGQQTPDLSCPTADLKIKALYQDANDVAKALMPSNSGGRTSMARVITLDDDGKTVRLSPGEAFTLQLGDQYDWSISGIDQAVVKRQIGVMPIKGSQGVFRAGQAGEAVITGVGDPPCRKAQPPCELLSRSFRVAIVVH